MCKETVLSVVWQLAPEQGLVPMDEPSEVKKKCDEEADTTVTQICQVGHKVDGDEETEVLITGWNSVSVI